MATDARLGWLTRLRDQVLGGAFARVSSGRLDREHRTFVAMLELYCQRKHGSGCCGGRVSLCPECSSLEAYSIHRLGRCRFGESKPTCARCPVHCYQAGFREKIREMMRVAGPWMLWHHPVLCFGHVLDGFRPVPKRTNRVTPA